MCVGIGVHAVVRSEHGRARRVGDTAQPVFLRCLEDVQRPEHVDARAEQRVFPRGRDENGSQVHDCIAALDGSVDRGVIDDVTLPQLHLAGPLADDRVEERPIGLLIEDAHAMSTRQQGARRPRPDEAESARDEDLHQATAAASASKETRSSPARVSASVGSPTR